ncbi:MAG: hypothetical protein EBR10_08085 [Planctomycetes bacterium]|nr:hypothetical protein [Planctomycetota bacterium]
MFRPLSILLAAVFSPIPLLAACPCDLNCDGVVDADDLTILISSWGQAGVPADVDNSGTVGSSDLTTMLASWGPCAVSTPGWATLIEALPNPSVVTDPDLRAAISSTGLPWRVRDTATGIELILVPAGCALGGSFNMGCSASSQFNCAADEVPVHLVNLTSSFYLGRFEVTQAEWQARMGTNPSAFVLPSAQVPSSQVSKRPVESVTWNAVQSFLAGTGMRLPTEAEWEYACRARPISADRTAFHGTPANPAGTNNDLLLGDIAWFNGNANGQTRPVGGKAPNGFGLFDMSGNVWEWVNDRYSETYYQVSPVMDPPGPASSSTRVLRGGSWLGGYVSGRTSVRNKNSPSFTSNTFGFRVARNP